MRCAIRRIEYHLVDGTPWVKTDLGGRTRKVSVCDQYRVELINTDMTEMN